MDYAGPRIKSHWTSAVSEKGIDYVANELSVKK